MAGKGLLSICAAAILILGPLFFLAPGSEGLDIRMDRDLSNADASFWGEDAFDYSGRSVVFTGDVNGDGYDDLLIGAMGDTDGGAQAGQTYLILGKASGWAMDRDLSTASASFWGEDANDYSGYSVAGAGDVNGDGYDDFLIGAENDDDGGADAGQAYLIFGKTSGWAMDTDLSAASASFWGEDAGDYAGCSVAGAGDVNNDGYDDFLIGAGFEDDGGTDAGQVYLILGKSSGWARDTDLSAASASFWGEDAGDNAGISVAGAGDVNSDGYDDILIGAYQDDDGGSNAGQTYLVLGKASGWAMDTDLSAASASFWGEDLGDGAGFSVAGAGDVNWDGHDDILIGARWDDDGGSQAGQTYLILGKMTGWAMDTDLSAVSASFWGEDTADESGMSVAGAGDINKDGFSDIIIGALGDDDGGSDAGQAYIILGKVSGWAMDTDLLLASASYWGEDAGDNAAISVAGDGDVNGDGYDDILIGAWGDDDGGSQAGQTYLVMPFYHSNPAPNNLLAYPFRDGDGITLSWTGPDSLIIPSTYEIYRSTNGIDYILAAVVPLSTPFPYSNPPMTCIDKDVEEGQVYFYTVMAVYANGGTSEKTLPIRVECERPVRGSIPGFGMDSWLENAHASFWGEDWSDRSGYSVAGAGDVNGDGYDDIIIGAYLDEEGGSTAGQTYLILGRGSGWAMDTNLSAASASFWGEDADDQSGMSVAGAGDVNRDGYDDILIGAWADDDGGSTAGQTFLILGKASGWAMDTDLSASSASFWGEDSSDFSGGSVAGVGDVNGDGYDDFIIGAKGDDDGGLAAGQTYLILGKASGWAMDTDLSAASASFWGENAGDQSGYSVAGAGDVNGDGYDDILIGTYLNRDGGPSAGQTYLILGKPSGWAMDTDLSAASASFWGEDGGDKAGYSVAGAGDVNGDGYDDILVGAIEDEDGGLGAGQTYLVLGMASGWAMDTDLSAASASFWGEDAGDLAGYSVAGTGDVNGDGYDDILVGAIGDDDGGTSAGQTYLILGKAAGWAMDNDFSASSASFWGDDVGDLAGYSVAGAGDVDGDGHDDILIGAYGDDDGGGEAGQTYLIMPYYRPPSPRNLQATLSPSTKQIVLTWDAAGFWNRPITGYLVYRSADDKQYGEVAFRALMDRTYTDTNVTYGRTYYYFVRTVDGNGAVSPVTAMVSLVCDRDTDSDGTGDMADWDDDGDGYADGQDAFPLNPAEWLDTDCDGTGNNADTDDDNDGIPDASDPEPQNLQNALMYNLNFLNSTLQTVKNSVNNLTTMVNSMSGTVSGIEAGLAGMNSTLSGQLGSMNTGLSALMNNVNANMVGMNATLRGDILAVIGAISGMNLTTQNSIKGLNTSSNGTEILANISALNLTLRNNVSTVLAAMSGMNTTTQNGLSTVISAVQSLNSTLGSDVVTVLGNMNAMNFSLSGKLDAVRTTVTAISSDVSSLDDELAAMNGSLAGRMDGMETRLAADILALSLALDAVNASVRAEMDSLGSEIAAFREQMRENLTAILDKMDKQNQTQADNHRKLESLMNSINSTSLADIKKQIAELDASTDLLGANISQKVDDFRSATLGRFDNISKLMVTADDIKSLTTEVKSVQAQVGDVLDQQAGTKKSVEALAPPSWGSMVLIIIVLVVSMLLLAGSRGKKNGPVGMEPAARTGAPAPGMKQAPPPEGEGMDP